MKTKPSYEELVRRVQELETDCSQLEKKLHQTKLFSEEIMTYMTEGLVLTDSQETVVFINQRLSEMLGYPSEQIIGKCWLDMISAEQQTIARQVLASRIQGHTDRYEIILRHRDGHKFPVLIGAGPRFDKRNGKFIGTMGVVNDISERKLAEEALRESQATFRDLFEKSADAILLIDQRRVFVECNQAALNLLKMSRREFLNRPLVMISPEFQPDGRRSDEAAQEMIDQACANGLHRFDWTCVNSEGGEFIVDVSLMPILINGQNMLHATWRDITKRKQVETELQKSKLITDSIPVGLYLYHLEVLSNDRTLRMVYANPAVKALTSLGPEKVVGKTLDENFPGLRARGIPQRYAEVVRTQTAITFEDITYGDSRVLLASFSVSAFPLPGNMVGIAFENITERKRMEEALRLSETGFRQLFQESPLSTILFDKDTGDLVDVNAVALKAYGCSTLEELRGCDFWCDPPYSLADALEWNRKASEEGFQQFQWLSQKKSGEFFWEDVFLRRLDIQGKPRIIAVSVDITERKRIEEERKKLQTQLNQAQKMESVGRLAGGVAHDFNNMLGVILGHTEMALEKLDPAEPLFANLQAVQHAAERSASPDPATAGLCPQTDQLPRRCST